MPEFQAYTVGISLSPVQMEQFSAFERELYAANLVMNLTRVPRDECRQRHFLDSLLFQDMIPAGASVLDIGTGPGFPAWPIACARPDLTVTAMDSNGKMLSFLECMPLGNLRVVKARAEEWDQQEAFDFVTGRAVAPLAVQLEISAACCKVGGSVVPMRTPSDLESTIKVNLQPLGLELQKIVERPLPETDIVRLFPVYKKIRSTAPGYPRRWADIKRQPL